MMVHDKVQEGGVKVRTQAETPARLSITNFTRLVLLCLEQERDGRFSVFAPELLDVGSQGRTVDEAFEMGKDSLEAVLESYKEHGEEPPWETFWGVPTDTMARWVVVDL